MLIERFDDNRTEFRSLIRTARVDNNERVHVPGAIPIVDNGILVLAYRELDECRETEINGVVVNERIQVA
jgi:hypothetical protein